MTPGGKRRQRNEISQNCYIGREGGMMAELPGRRLPDGADLNEAQPGDYWKPIYEQKQPNEWWFRDPFGVVGRITKHVVTEHDDGTITAKPSILRNHSEGPLFHGWLTAGVWTW